jgi:hypothetical protein
MSQPLRRVLIAFSLMAAFSLAAPLPSQGAGLRNPLTGYALEARFWSWIEGLLPGAISPKPSSKRPILGMEKEGSGINPNGASQPTPLSAPHTSAAPNPANSGGTQ